MEKHCSACSQYIPCKYSQSPTSSEPTIKLIAHTHTALVITACHRYSTINSKLPVSDKLSMPRDVSRNELHWSAVPYMYSCSTTVSAVTTT